MQVLLIGLNHKTAPIQTRERVAFTKRQLREAIPLLVSQVNQSIILSTCNRTEIYAVTDHPEESTERIIDFVCGYHQVERRTIEPLLYVMTDREAVNHLFRVASGLDSMVLGESEILGQMRDTLTTASDTQSLASLVSRLLHRAIRTGRRVRNETGIGQNSLSISYSAVQLVNKILGDLQDLRVLLVGVGEAGRLLAKALISSGVSEITIANRTEEKSKDLAEDLGGHMVPFQQATAHLANADVIVSATEASQYIITKDAVAESSIARKGKPISLFDLSVPRNIDPSIASLSNVTLFNIDDLTEITETNNLERQGAVSHADRIVNDELAQFVEWWEALDAIPLIKALREKGERIRNDELSRASAKLSSLTDEELATIHAMSQSIVNRILHNPTIALKKHHRNNSLLNLAKDIFGV